MSFDLSAYYADVIPWEDIQKLCPRQAALVDLALAQMGVDKTDWIRGLIYEDMATEMETTGLTDEQIKTLYDLFDNLNGAFEKATRKGKSCLSLEPTWASDTDEEIENGCFHVEGAYALTPAGKKFQKLFSRTYYVTGG